MRFFVLLFAGIYLAGVTMEYITNGPLRGLELPADLRVDLAALSGFQHAVLLVLYLAEPLVVLHVLYRLYRLFAYYRAGVVLEVEDVECLRRIGWGMVAIDIVVSLADTLAGPVLWAVGALPERYFGVDLNLDLVLIGSFVVVISHVMRLGRDFKERDALTI
jgi:hypothetical protein